MPNLTLGTNPTYNSVSKTRASFATQVDTITESTGALVLGRGTKFDNSNGLQINGTTAQTSQTISTNTQGSVNVETGGGPFGHVVTIDSGVWVWSDSIVSQAIYISLDGTTIVNNGYIIGKGGNGQSGTGGPGASAILIANGTNDVTIINNSGAYIAGGGGGGGGEDGGGGAGGGNGGGTASYPGGSGGSINSSGGNGTQLTYGGDYGRGGQAGGGGGGPGGGGGGGRILPGTGGDGNSLGGGSGGGAGNAGTNGVYNSPTSRHTDGGGGGWGASGGSSSDGSGGGTGGRAVFSNQSYTLTNNGTIYGVT